MDNLEKKFAILIDSENVPSKYISNILDEMSTKGTATIRRIYGDWSNASNNWSKDCMLENSIHPIQQFGYTRGKNATDSAMIIDAMDLLYTGDLDGFCLVSSDSDFTRLAERLREAGKYVIGMGESKTPTAFRQACTNFIILDALEKENIEDNTEIVLKVTDIKKIRDTIFKILDENEDKGKSTHLGEIGSGLTKRFSDFDVRNYGYSKLSVFVEEAFDTFSLDKNETTMIVRKRNNAKEKDEIAMMIAQILEENDRKVSNMGILKRELKKQDPFFSEKSYGYSKFSSFIKSFNWVKVKGNEVSLK